MRNNWTNEVLIEGYVYNAKLFSGVTGPDTKRPNTEYISGTVNMVVDEEGINIVPVRFNFVTKTWASGAANSAWDILQDIMNKDCTWEKNGKDNALRLRLSCSVGVNDFMGRDGNMVETKVINCSFAHVADQRFNEKRNDFKVDMLIAATALQEVEDGDDYMNVRGYTFNYRGDLIPITLTMRNPAGIKYLESQDINNSNPMLTQVWGKIISTTRTIQKEIESAFGGPTVETTTQTLRAWDIVGCIPEPYEFDDETTITRAELKEKLQEREIQKADAKKRQEERQQKNSSGFPANNTQVSEPKKTSNAIYDDFPF